MVLTRNTTYVTKTGLVPIEEICDNISQGKSIYDVSNRFGISNMEIYDAVDFYANNTDLEGVDQGIKLANSSQAGEDEISLEILSIHETVYLKCISASRKHYPEFDDFVANLNNGIRIIAIENIIDLRNKQPLRSELHKQIHTALLEVIPDFLMDSDKVLRDLDADEYVQRLEYMV